MTTVAVFAHEIPQEVGDFAVLLNGGYTRRQALLLNLLVSLTSVAGAVLAYHALQAALPVLPYALAVAAASFLYVAIADLIPGMHGGRFRAGSSRGVIVAGAVYGSSQEDALRDGRSGMTSGRAPHIGRARHAGERVMRQDKFKPSSRWPWPTASRWRSAAITSSSNPYT